MKRLTLLRHAKTERESSTGRDFDRRLTERGRADAGRMCRAIREFGLSFDLGLSSPARRAIETAEIVGLEFQIEPQIYEASLGELMDVVRAANDRATSLILVGHNPGFEQLLRGLANVDDDMPTGSLAEIELPTGCWREVEGGKGRLLRFLKPKEMTEF